MKKLFEDKKVAIIVMLVMILFATLYGSHRSLNKLYQKVNTIFYQGENNDGESIDNDLSIRVDTANNLVYVAEKYQDQIPSSLIDDVIEAINKLSNATNITDKYAANNLLSEATDALIGNLEMISSISQQDSQYISGFKVTLNSRNDTIERDSYNEKAEEYNQVLKSSPANILSKLTGIKKAQTFN